MLWPWPLAVPTPPSKSRSLYHRVANNSLGLHLVKCRHEHEKRALPHGPPALLPQEQPPAPWHRIVLSRPTPLVCSRRPRPHHRPQLLPQQPSPRRSAWPPSRRLRVPRFTPNRRGVSPPPAAEVVGGSGGVGEAAHGPREQAVHRAEHGPEPGRGHAGVNKFCGGRRVRGERQRGVRLCWRRGAVPAVVFDPIRGAAPDCECPALTKAAHEEECGRRRRSCTAGLAESPQTQYRPIGVMQIRRGFAQARGERIPVRCNGCAGTTVSVANLSGRMSWEHG